MYISEAAKSICDTNTFHILLIPNSSNTLTKIISSWKLKFLTLKTQVHCEGLEIIQAC